MEDIKIILNHFAGFILNKTGNNVLYLYYYTTIHLLSFFLCAQKLIFLIYKCARPKYPLLIAL